MDEVIINCPNCQQKISCTAEYEGQEFICPTCGQSLTLTGVTSEHTTGETTAITGKYPPQTSIDSSTKNESTADVLLKENERKGNIFTSDFLGTNISQKTKKNTKKEIKIPCPPQSSSRQKNLFFFAILSYILGVISIMVMLWIVFASNDALKDIKAVILGYISITMFIAGTWFSAAAELLEHQRQSCFYTKKLFELMWEKEHKK